jgi:8-oxo-dGTP diphosphatase
MSIPVIEVVVAVIIKSDRSFLLARRPKNKPCGGYWEFPGGKIEPGESRPYALNRELMEELGIQIELAYPWITLVYTYSHATVRLFFYRIEKWHGEPYAKENQELSWQFADDIRVSPMLPTNVPVLQALSLPPVYQITNAADLGVEDTLIKLKNSFRQGTKLVQIREPEMIKNDLCLFAHKVVELAHFYGVKVLMNADTELSREIGVDGIHFSSAQLMEATSRPEANLCGASCHNVEELYQAERLGMDFVVLGPVLPTLSHPGATLMGWRKFAAIIRDFPLPVYALGGMKLEDLTTSWEHGAHGIAMIRG